MSAIPKYPDLPTRLSSFGAAVVDDYLYVYGGHSGEAHHYSTDTTSGALRRLNLKQPDRWEELSGGPKLQGMSLVAHSGKLYRVGGMQPQNAKGQKSDLRSQAACGVFDVAGNSWSDTEPMPEPRSSHDAAVVGDALYVFGGWGLKGLEGKPAWMTNGLRLDLASSRWEAIEQTFRRRALTVAALDNKVFVMGGLNEAGKVERTVNVFDTNSGSWTDGPPLPVDDAHGFTPASAVQDGRLYLAPADGKLYVLNDTRDAWSEAGRFREGRFSARMVPGPDGTLVLIGGANPTSLLSSLEVVSPRR